jgi:calcineurin-like phosphoesterase family protein
MNVRSKDIWFISDTHFCHSNILKFLDRDEKPIRGGRFPCVEDMNCYMIEQWNSVVKPQDKVYHLGDVFVGVQRAHEAEEIMKSLNGHKRLILGNHDHVHAPYYRHFEKIDLWTGGKFKPEGFVCSHIPLRKDQMRDGEVNVHGHIHQNLITWQLGSGASRLWGVDQNYINVCVEHTDYKPVHLDEIVARIKNRNS